MADGDLIFRQLPLAQPADLLFGETENLPDVEATLVATLPALTASLQVGSLAEVTLSATLPPLVAALVVVPVIEVTLAAVMPGLQAQMAAQYLSDTQRPTVGQVATDFQPGAGVDGSARQGWEEGGALKNGATTGWTPASPTPAGVAPGWVESSRRRSGIAARHQEAAAASASAASGYKNMLRGIRPALDAAWQLAAHRQASARTDWQQRLRAPRPSALTSWGLAQRVLAQLQDQAGPALPLVRTWGSRYQEAIVPPAGMALPPVIPPGVPCYTPPPGNAVHLLFADAPGDGQLVFVCERHITPPGETVVVPVRRVYIVINNTSLLKVEGTTLTALPTYSMSLSIDVDSWTWGLSASLPAEALSALQPVDGVPVELEASVNGVGYRFVAEKLARERSFGKAAIRLTGRGKSALLSAPYAPIMNFANTETRTAQQLMNDALTLNGVPIGWDVEWNIDDWLVPAGAWTKQGTYIDALATIAAAAGAYLQPHPTAQTMRVLARYPFAPWEWSSEITPDYELPASVTTVESIEWVDKPLYNRVFVSGVSAGVLGQVTRGGTDGALLAPMVTDALITETAAARQRGRAVLSDTGRQAMVSLKLPVLAETGLITPGKFVRYVDGTDVKLGVVRGIGADSNGNADVWQTIAVETHVEA